MRRRAKAPKRRTKCYVCGTALTDPRPEGMIGAACAGDFCGQCAEDMRREQPLANLSREARIRERLTSE